ncbi:MAG: LLM class flavin-dependent oxidoreductase [Candidatus Bathyarchaeota archaeon]|nr:LLM class flavin-dependent oxidoreductase [Candidatus Bathyarchaeota archaeon]
MPKPKFGVFLPFYAFQALTPNMYYDHLREVVLECEKLGYASVWLDDHLMYGNWQILEPWTTLSALSSLTSKIRLGTMVTCSAHRNPALLAKTAATLDVISHGRLEFGVGAGVQENEHIAYGFDFPKLNQRVERLFEALEVIIRLWTQPKANYSGKYFSLKEAICEPKPLQSPYPPITIGGISDKTVKVAAQFADRCDWGFLPTIDAYKQKTALLQQNCRAVGRDFDEIERSCWPAGQIIVAQTKAEVAEKISRFKPANHRLEDFLKTTLGGTPDVIYEQLQTYVELGVSYFMLFFADLPRFDSLRLFSETIIKPYL